MNISEQPLYFQITVKLLLAGLIIAFLILAQNILIPLTISVSSYFSFDAGFKKTSELAFPKDTGHINQYYSCICSGCCCVVLFC